MHYLRRRKLGNAWYAAEQAAQRVHTRMRDCPLQAHADALRRQYNKLLLED